MKVIAEARIRNGKLEMKQRSTFVTDLKALADGDYILTVEKKKKKRSLMQNAYYWGVIVPLVKDGLKDTGYEVTTELVHEYLKSRFNIVEIVNEHSGEILKTVGSTTEMSTSDMMAYFERIFQWAAEYLNMKIPEPGQQLTII